MFGNLSEVWVAIILSIGVLVVIGRWIYAKTTGKELVPGDSNILANLRSKIVKEISSNKELFELEKTQGREAVRKEIEKKINEYIQNAEMLTEDEKELLISLDKGKLIEYIEKEIVKLGILKE